MGAFEDAFSPRNPTIAEPAEQEPQEPATQTQPDAEPAQAQQAAQAEPAQAEPTQQEPSHVPLAALHEERRKRQELERKQQEIERKLAEAEAFRQAALQFQAKPQSEKPKEPEEDDETRFYRDPIGYQRELVKRAIEETERKNFALRVEASKRLLLKEVQDYDAAEAEFMRAAEHDENLKRQVMHHPDPARFAYEVGRMIHETRGIGSITEYRKKVEAEVEARIRAELAKQQPQVTKEDDYAPPSPGATRGVGASHKPEPSREEFFSSVFNAPRTRRARAG